LLATQKGWCQKRDQSFSSSSEFFDGIYPLATYVAHLNMMEIPTRILCHPKVDRESNTFTSLLSYPGFIRMADYGSMQHDVLLGFLDPENPTFPVTPLQQELVNVLRENIRGMYGQPEQPTCSFHVPEVKLEGQEQAPSFALSQTEEAFSIRHIKPSRQTGPAEDPFSSVFFFHDIRM
jgi:hypothetical protein